MNTESVTEKFAARNYGQVLTTMAGKKIRYRQLPEHSCAIESFMFEFLQSFNIPVAYTAKLDDTTIELAKTTEFLFGIRVSNNVDWRISEVLQLPKWSPYQLPVLEYFPISNPKVRLAPHHIVAANLASTEELKALNRIASKINVVVKAFFERRDAQLFAFNCLFGKVDEKILLTGNFFPPNMQIIKNEHLATMPDDYFAFQNGKKLKAYVEQIIEILRR
ncbi:MAG: hypothetical protein LWX56_09900 [Ignavibacteria bacterium]|nr:hypothetical protein [Ignavibacteria bacterium]